MLTTPPPMQSLPVITYKHTGNALVSCVCDAADHLLFSSLVNGVVCLLPTGLANRRNYQCIQELVSKDQILLLYVQLQISYFLFFPFYFIAFIICSAECNALHQYLLCTYSVHSFVSVRKCIKMVKCRL